MNILIPAATAAVYPLMKESFPNQVSATADFLAEHNVGAISTIACGALTVATGVFTGSIPITAVAYGSYIAAGFLAGLIFTEAISPSIENQLPVVVTDNVWALSAARVSMPPLAVSVGTLAITYKKAAMLYSLSYSITEKFITPAVLDIDKTDDSTRVAVTSLMSLVPMASGYGALQIPIIADSVGCLGTIYTHASRVFTALSLAYSATNIVTSNTMENSLAIESANVVLSATIFMSGKYLAKNQHVAKVAKITNGFLNIDEAILMSLITIVNERLLKTVSLPDDPMLRTVVSDASNTVKTGASWQMGLKKGTAPYTGLKTVGAAMKTAIKLAPSLFSKFGIVEEETELYCSVGAAYLADLPSTWLSEGEKSSARSKEPLLYSMFSGDVLNIAATSSSLKTAGSDIGSKVAKIWQNNVVSLMVNAGSREVQINCNFSDVSEFCTYLTVASLPRCVQQYIACKISNGYSLEINKEVKRAVEASIKNVSAVKKTKEDTFCKFLEGEAVRNDEDLDLSALRDIRSQDISENFWSNISISSRVGVQQNYGQFISISEFAQGTKQSLSLWDYPIRFIKSSFPKNNLVKRSLKLAPIVGSLFYLGNEVSYKMHDVSKKVQAISTQKQKDGMLKESRLLLTKDWQEFSSAHKGGYFNKEALAAQPQKLLKSLHLCNKFEGYRGAVDFSKISDSTVNNILDEIDTGCSHIREAEKVIDFVPHAEVIKIYEGINELVAGINIYNYDIHSLNRINETCHAISHVISLENHLKGVCVQVNEYLEELIVNGQGIIHEVVGKELSSSTIS